MKLVDKMILFSRFLRENTKHKINLDQTLQENKNYFKDQSKYWRDRSTYEYLESTIENLQSLLDIYNNTITSLDSKTNELLRKEEIDLLRRDYDNYYQIPRTYELMKERFNTSKDWIDLIKTQIGAYSEWRFACLELNPTDGILTHSMLACDPLYISSSSIMDKESIKNKFNKFFAEKRLLFYQDLDRLPSNQIGTAVSINAYEFMPIDPIKDEMKKVYNLLRPGGYFIFTYSDCELEVQLDLLHGPGAYISYNTKALMTSMVEGLGFDLVKEECWRDSQSYMVVKKPGELTSQKLSGALVKITDKI